VATATTTRTEPQDRPPRRRGLVFLVPLALFVAVGAFLAIGLTRDPRTLPSTLIGREAPAFELPPLPGRAAGEGGALSRADLGGGKGPTLVNVFASWCVPCRIEHPVIARLAEEHGVTVHGLNYKDRPEAALAWLKEVGDPYAKVGSDRNGRVGIEWGVYGVPETFVIDKEGRVAYKHVGPLQPRDLERTILPLLEKLK
jgi:cytochrome c biogenesis protein CcmG, thiol:disulfide interchange protein DsbE